MTVIMLYLYPLTINVSAHICYCSFDTVGWVFWPIKPVPDMTYNVFGGMLNLAQLIYCSITKQYSYSHVIWIL